MPKYEHDNWGDIQDYVFIKGVILNVDSQMDTAEVELPGYGISQDDIPIFYHCSPDAEERDNGAIEGGSSPFAVDDEVIVMCEADTYAPVRILGFIDGIRACGWIEPFAPTETKSCLKNHWSYRLHTYNDQFPGLNCTHLAFYSEITTMQLWTCDWKVGPFRGWDSLYPVEEATIPWSSTQNCKIVTCSVLVCEGDPTLSTVCQWTWKASKETIPDPTIEDATCDVFHFETSCPGCSYSVNCLEEEDTLSKAGHRAPYSYITMSGSTNMRVSDEESELAKFNRSGGGQCYEGSWAYDNGDTIEDQGWAVDRYQFRVSSGIIIDVKNISAGASTMGRLVVTFRYMAHKVDGDTIHSQGKVFTFLAWADPTIIGDNPIDVDWVTDSPYKVAENWGNGIYLPGFEPMRHHFGLQYFDHEVWVDGSYKGQADYFTAPPFVTESQANPDHGIYAGNLYDICSVTIFITSTVEGWWQQEIPCGVGSFFLMTAGYSEYSFSADISHLQIS